MIPQRSAKDPKPETLRRILVRCPGTAKLFDTGLTTKATEFAAIKVTDNELPCSFCGKVHRWAQENVVLGRISIKGEGRGSAS
jgi:hypothetical protein